MSYKRALTASTASLGLVLVDFLLFLGREKARIIGQTITELDIQPLLNTDKPITQENMRGKVVVLHFWGYWCGPCVTEYPDFVQLQMKYKDDSDFVFVSSDLVARIASVRIDAKAQASDHQPVIVTFA